ncbi:MAG: ATP-binding protein [Deltaproteobacteria bacterium]|jgi:two-component system sensor histidine kinase HydH|nr:ATP-binding protein [Deltaproteobacteria bacterium]
MEITQHSTQYSAQEKDDVFRLPRWLLLFLVLGVLGLAFLMAQRDFGRESLYLEELYVQKGEVLIRSLTTAMRLGWTQGLSRENLAAFSDHLESGEVLYLAVTDVQGRLISSSVSPSQMPAEAFKTPDAPPSFQKPPLEPHRLVATQPNGRKIFWVYRPLWFTFQPSQPQARRRRRGQTATGEEPGYSLADTGLAGQPEIIPLLEGSDFQSPAGAENPALNGPDGEQPAQAEPPAEPQASAAPASLSPENGSHLEDNSAGPADSTEPPAVTETKAGTAESRPEAEESQPRKRWWHLESDNEPPARPPWPEDVSDWSKGLYCWVGFDMKPIEAASRSGRLNTILFVGLLGAASLGGLLALFWAYNYRQSKRLYQEANDLASEIFDRLPVGLILDDHRGMVTFANETATKLTGLSSNEIKGQTLLELTDGAFPDDDELNGLEMDIRFKYGPAQRLSLTCGPIVDSEGLISGRIILMMDVGELGRLKEELATKQRLATLGGMAAGLAHEIRNPLGAIRGLTQHLLAKSGESFHEALEVMLISVDRLDRTINDFLDYAKPTELKTAEVSLGPFLSRIHELIGHDARSQNVDMSLTLPVREVTVTADDGRLAQAILNLYLNAIQAVGPDGGGQVTVELKVQRNRAVVTLADNGPGFGADQIAQPFVPYVTSKDKGSGLGLALVKKIIDAHQGEVTLTNQTGGGALITISLPLKTEAPPAISPPPKETLAGQAQAPGSEQASEHLN